MKKHVHAILVFLTLTGAAFAQSNSKYEVKTWGEPPSHEWASGTVSVASDHKGSMLVLRRSDPPILVFTPEGKFIRGFGDGMFQRAHSIDVDRNGFIWATDSGFNVVYKFSTDGKLLMTLGRKGVTGDNNSHDAFNGPSDVITAPNGDIFVSDGDHNNRIVKFTKDGKFIKIIGGKGKGPGMFAPLSDDAKPTEGLVHAIAWDSKGRIVTVESYNPRIQFFDQDGKFLEQWVIPGFIKPCGLYVAPDDTIYVSDTEAGMIFLVKNGKVVETIPDPGGRPHNMDVDAAGAIYTADNTNKTVKKIVRK